MNAPEPGTIKDFLANEEDTVTVGQDLLTLELGGLPKGGEKQRGGQQPKAPATDQQSTSSDPKPQKDPESPEPESVRPPERKSEPSKQESKPSSPQNKQPMPKEPTPKPQEKKSDPRPNDTAPSGHREERRVSSTTIRQAKNLPATHKGENEPHALAYLRTS